MKNRVNSVDEAKEIIADFHGRKIEVYNNHYKGSHGDYKWQKKSIIRIIPMHYPGKKSIDDVEVLLNKSRNTYFSIGMFLRNKSWIKDIKIGGIDFKAKSQKIINPFPKNDEVWIRTARYINLLYLKSNKELKELL